MIKGEMRMLLGLVLLAAVTRAHLDLAWSDEFDGTQIDSSKWTHEITQWGGGNKEFQVYTSDSKNAYVKNGKLFIKPMLFEEITNPKTGLPYGPGFRQSNQELNLYDYYGRCDTPWDNNGCVRTGADIPPTASARLRTTGKFGFRYGRVEISAKMPVGDWLWPAIWLLPESWCYGDWPRSGEIDICEILGNEDLRRADGSQQGIEHAASTLHWGPRWDETKFYLTSGGRINQTSDYGRQFHTYVLEWTHTGLSFSVDSQLLLDVPNPSTNEWQGFFEFGKPWSTIDGTDPNQNPWRVNNDPLIAPFDTKFHFLLNVAVGGTAAFPDDSVNRGGNPAFVKPWNNGQNQYDAMNAFYDARCSWKWTWDQEGDNNAMQVDYIRVYKDDNIHPPEQTSDCPT